MRYLPKSPADRKEMLAEIGVASIDDLFSTIPAEYRLTRDLDVPRQHGEQEVIEHFKAGGPGWQTRIDLTLAAAIKKRA